MQEQIPTILISHSKSTMVPANPLSVTASLLMLLAVSHLAWCEVVVTHLSSSCVRRLIYDVTLAPSHQRTNRHHRTILHKKQPVSLRVVSPASRSTV